MTRCPQSACHSAGIVGQGTASTPVIGRDGLLRLVEWAGQLRARNPAGGGARGRASSPDGGADECSGRGAVEVVSGIDPGRHREIAGMLLERVAVSAGLAAEGTGGEHDAAG